MPQIEVIFDIDANGILHVTAKDKATGKSQNIRIEASSGLTDEEIKKMKHEAEANAESDRKLKEETEKVNSADQMIFQTEKQLKEYGDKIPAEKKAPIEKALEDLKAAHKDKNLAGIETALATMNTAWQAASEDMYKASQGGAPGGDGGAGGSNFGQDQQGGGQGQQQQPQNDGSVTDVDFEEVKDEKK
jgi:molecular chaperone DnaK